MFLSLGKSEACHHHAAAHPVIRRLITLPQALPEPPSSLMRTCYANTSGQVCPHADTAGRVKFHWDYKTLT